MYDKHETIDHISIFSIEIDLACNGGFCGGISLKRNEFYLHILKILPTLASVESYSVHCPILRNIRI